jgi:hypothetical protein
VVAKFEQRPGSSGGGAIPLEAAERPRTAFGMGGWSLEMTDHPVRRSMSCVPGILPVTSHFQACGFSWLAFFGQSCLNLESLILRFFIMLV